jgi:hypothetical protein
MKSLLKFVPALFFAAMAIVHSSTASEIASQLNPSNSIVAVGGGDSYAPITTPDGRFVVFTSTSANLASSASGQPFATQVPAVLNVFEHDRQLGLTKLVTVDVTANASGNADSFPNAVSPDGRYVLFESSASNLVAGAANGVKNIYIREMSSGLTTLVSIGTNGVPADADSREASMTPDGRFVAFVSAASNLVPNDTNGIPDVYIRDISSGTTALVTVGAASSTNIGQFTTPLTAGSSSEWPTISANGRYVVFYSTAINLVPGQTNIGDIFIRDLSNSATLWVSSNADSIFPATVNPNYSMTPDARYIAFYSTQGSSTNAGLSPQNGAIFRYALASDVTEMVATNGCVGVTGDPDERPLDISTNGQIITFLQANLSNSSSVQIWNAQSSTSLLVSGGSTNEHCDFPRLDATGRYVAFLSDESTLATNSDNSSHLYLRDTVSGDVQLVDVSPSGTLPFSSPSTQPSFAAIGNLIFWCAPDGNLVISPGKFDVFGRNLSTAKTEMISTTAPSLGSLTGFGVSGLTPGSVSSNGTLVAFESDADGLVPSDTNGLRDIYVHNMLTRSNTLVSVSLNGTTSGSGSSFSPAMDASGRYVIFASNATNLVANDTNGVTDIFIRDLQSNTTKLVSMDVTGEGEANGISSLPSISVDGRYALFASMGNNLVTNQVRINTNVFYRRDLQQGLTVAISPHGALAAAMTTDGSMVVWADTFDAYWWQASSGTYTIFNGIPAGLVAISPDGAKAAVAASFPGVNRIYLVDLLSNTNVILTNIVWTPWPFQFSADGKFLASVVANGNINQLDLFDLVTGSNTLISQAYDSTNGGNGSSDSPAFSSDGRYIAYRSVANNLVPGDDNGWPDIFLYDRATRQTTLITASQFGNYSGNSVSRSPVFSGDGQTLFFSSWSSDLIPGDFNQYGDVFAVPLSASSPVATTNSIPPLGFNGIAFTPSNPASPFNIMPTLTWPTAPGVGYQVQFKNNLTDPEWQNLPQPATVIGSQGSVSDPSTNAPQRFYRIISF